LDEVSQSFWSDEELNDYINAGYYYYWQWMLNAKHPGTIKTTYISIVSGVASYPLPSDFHSARLVERVFNSETVPMQYYERFETANRISATVVSYLRGYLPRYHFEGENLVLEPTPADNIENGIKLTYRFIPPRLSKDTDSPHPAFHDFYHELLVGYCVIQAKEKEEMVGGGGADIVPFIRSHELREQKFKETIELSSEQRVYVEPFGIEVC